MDLSMLCVVNTFKSVKMNISLTRIGSRLLARSIPARSIYTSDSSDGTELVEANRYIHKDEVRRFMKDAMMKVGTEAHRAEQIAENLFQADYRGHFSHGLNRLAMYIQDIEKGFTNPNADPETLKKAGSTAWVEGNNGLGVIAGTYAMELAIQMAKETGIGWVAVKGSNHFGICQYYTDMALEKGLIGIASTNTSPLVSPCRAKTPIYGTNPLAFAAPGLNGDFFNLDMSTSAVAVGKIEIQMRKKEAMPNMWALGKDGLPTTDPSEAYHNGCGEFTAVSIRKSCHVTQ